MPLMRHRRLVEREVKKMLLEAAKRGGLSPRSVAEWLREEYGINARPEWRSIEKALLSPEVTSNEFAAFLVDNGVEVPEEKWIEILRKYGIRV